MRPQNELAALAYGQRLTERRVAVAVKHVRQLVEDDYPIAPALADAIRLPVAVLALPKNVGRFWDLYADATA